MELIATTDVTLGLEQTVFSSALLLRILYRVLVEQLAHHNRMYFSGRTKLACVSNRKWLLHLVNMCIHTNCTFLKQLCAFSLKCKIKYIRSKAFRFWYLPNCFVSVSWSVEINWQCIYSAEYNPDQYLWETEFTLAGRKYKRLDLEASKGHNYVDFLVSFICEDLVLTIDIIAC